MTAFPVLGPQKEENLKIIFNIIHTLKIVYTHGKNQVISGCLVRTESSLYLTPSNPTNLEVSPLKVIHTFQKLEKFLTQTGLIWFIICKSPLQVIQRKLKIGKNFGNLKNKN